MFGIATGRADGNDADRLADDPIYKLLLGRDPAADGPSRSPPGPGTGTMASAAVSVTHGGWSRGSSPKTEGWSLGWTRSVPPANSSMCTMANVRANGVTAACGVGLIRFGGHLPRGEYDVDHDGHAGQADAAELHG